MLQRYTKTMKQQRSLAENFHFAFKSIKRETTANSPLFYLTRCQTLCELVINIVWSNDLGKWIWMDASFAAYVTDENGLLLHLGEVRERLRKDLPVFLNEDANWNHKTPQTKDEYINYYMAKNLYLFDSHVRSETESEGPDGDKSPIVTLVPQGFVFNSGKVTEDEAEFWHSKFY